MKLNDLSNLLLIIFCMVLPLKAEGAIYQMTHNQTPNVLLNQRVVGEKKRTFKEKLVFKLLSKQIKKQKFNTDESVKKRVDGFAIVSLILAFSILIAPSLGLAILLLMLSLLSGIIAIIRISLKPNQRGGIVFAVLGALISILILVASKNSFR